MIQPALFVSHGAPDVALSDAPARHFLETLGRRLERPDASWSPSPVTRRAERRRCARPPASAHGFDRKLLALDSCAFGEPEAIEPLREPAMA